ncbi:tyrosyl-dna phosphodiesterase [Culex quinquefasciatus]|uniref:Tyrosyl-dna phosphodiesterase n=1 Tax=Culex quinquefasciatus TaxID=7176 RepID=B0W5E3_CULQU|nr:tyrosyl-dna phosphodiesterase [Culex quinquefasciatus]|eukprot:XP_001843931.1 tyrosyl-dna phosphodiesterase [Culex quinquefasciatus]
MSDTQMVSDVAGCALTHVEEERVSAEDVLFIQLLEDESFNAEELAGPDEMSPAVVGLMPVNRGDKQSAKAEWGVYNKSAKFEAPLRINSYEKGVLFLLTKTSSRWNRRVVKHPAFPMPYDVPIIPYAPEDSPLLDPTESVRW